MLVAMVFALPGLDWSQPTDHAELFSGGMAVTIGEIEACYASVINHSILFLSASCLHCCKQLDGGGCIHVSKSGMPG